MFGTRSGLVLLQRPFCASITFHPFQQTNQCTAIFKSLHSFKMEFPKLKKVSLEERSAFYVRKDEKGDEVFLGGDGLEERRKDLEDPLLGMLVDDKEEREWRRVCLIR